MSAAYYSAVKTTLGANSGLTALVPSSRIWAGFIPEGVLAPSTTYPCITFDVDEEALSTHDEDSAGRFAELLLECTIYSRKRDPSAELAPIEAALTTAVLGLTGVISGRTYSGARFEAADFSQWVPGSETWEKDMRYRVMVSA